MPEPGYNPNAVSSYYNPNKSTRPKLRPAGLGSRPSGKSRADRKGESAVFSAPKPVYTPPSSSRDNNSKAEVPASPADNLYSITAESLMSAGGGSSLSSPSSKRALPMTLYEQKNMQEMKTELEDYLRGVAIEDAITADMAVPEVYTGETEDVTVKAGDTLTAIAKDKGVSLQELIDANPQITNPDMIRPGEKVAMPSKDIVTTPITTTEDTSTLKGSQAGLMTNTSSTVETPDFESLEGPEAAFSASQQVLSSLENTIKLGEKSNLVMNAQLRLVDLGYDIGRGGKKGLAKNKYGKWVSLDNSQIRGVDSDFGSKTQKAVMAFQKDAGLPVTGDIDITTAKALSEKESVMYRVPVGFTKNYTATQKQNFKAAEEAGVGAGLKGVELASYMAQVAHESDNFKTSEEYASGAAYEGRKDLGNTQVGDGKKYKGRAYIQLTGRDNYKKAGDALGLDLINNPALAEEPKNAAAISVWFWKTKVKPQVPDFMDTERVTKVVNGGFNGLNDRLKYFDRFTKKWSDAN